MNNSSRDNLKEVAEKIGNERANELDRYSSEQSLPELKEQIGDLIVLRRKSTVKKRLTVLVATLLAGLLLVGGMTIYKLNFGLADNGTHSTLTPLITSEDFKYMVTVPTDYQISEVTKKKAFSRVTFVCGDDLIVFTESKTDLTVSIDTEDTAATRVLLSNGYEGFYIDKNGATLLWSVGGYYYELYCSNSDLDILAIATTLDRL